MNDAKFQAMLDLFTFYGSDVMCNSSEWDELSCSEQMYVMSHIE
jgi:hypothetical protein